MIRGIISPTNGVTLRAIPARWAFIAAVLTTGAGPGLPQRLVPGRPRRRVSPRTPPVRESGRSPLGACVAHRTGAAAAPGPDAGQGALLAEAGVRRKNSPPDGFLARLTLEPDFEGLVPCPRRDRRRTRFGEVFLNAASGSDFGCCGRRDSRKKPSAANCLPTLCW